MGKKILVAFVGLIVMALTLGSPAVFAKKHDDKQPKGWTQGKKKGWKDALLPPGQAKGEAKKAGTDIENQETSLGEPVNPADGVDNAIKG